MVATNGSSLVGCITGYRPQQRSDTLFVWQVAVSTSCRGQRLAYHMLRHLLSRPELEDVSWVEATVGPDNVASRSLFAGLAKEREVRMSSTPLFGPDVLGEGHDPEVLHRVGPLDLTALRQAV